MKDTITKDYVRYLANELMFDLSEDEVEDVYREFDVLEQQLSLLEKIDTDGVQEMVYPFEDETTYLREDKVDHVIDAKDAIRNAKQTRKDYIILPRVVK